MQCIAEHFNLILIVGFSNLSVNVIFKFHFAQITLRVRHNALLSASGVELGLFQGRFQLPGMVEIFFCRQR